MVDRALARGALGMAASDAAAHNRIYGCFAPLLDECVFFAAASPRTAPGLLFNEYVERICALGGGGVAKNAGQLRLAGASLLSLVGIAIASLALLPKVLGQIDGSSGDADTR